MASPGKYLVRIDMDKGKAKIELLDKIEGVVSFIEFEGSGDGHVEFEIPDAPGLIHSAMPSKKRIQMDDVEKPKATAKKKRPLKRNAGERPVPEPTPDDSGFNDPPPAKSDDIRVPLGDNGD